MQTFFLPQRDTLPLTRAITLEYTKEEFLDFIDGVCISMNTAAVRNTLLLNAVDTLVTVVIDNLIRMIIMQNSEQVLLGIGNGNLFDCFEVDNRHYLSLLGGSTDGFGDAVLAEALVKDEVKQYLSRIYRENAIEYGMLINELYLRLYGYFGHYSFSYHRTEIIPPNRAVVIARVTHG